MDVGKSLRMLTQPTSPAGPGNRWKYAPRARWRLLAVLLPLLSAGIVHATATARPGDAFVVCGRVALFEPDIAMAERVGGRWLPRPEWAITARLLYTQAASEVLTRHDIDVAGTDASSVDDAPLVRQHVAAVATALLNRRRDDDASHALTDAVLRMRNADADYVLFTWIRVKQEGNGRAALRLAGRLLVGTLGRDEHAGVAMLVDVRTGQLVWYALLPGRIFDLRNLAGARDAAARLLSPLHGGRSGQSDTP